MQSGKVDSWPVHHHQCVGPGEARTTEEQNSRPQSREEPCDPYVMPAVCGVCQGAGGGAGGACGCQVAPSAGRPPPYLGYPALPHDRRGPTSARRPCLKGWVLFPSPDVLLGNCPQQGGPPREEEMRQHGNPGSPGTPISRVVRAGGGGGGGSWRAGWRRRARQSGWTGFRALFSQLVPRLKRGHRKEALWEAGW